MPSYYGRHARDDDCQQRKMGQAVTQDFSNATEIADYLANKDYHSVKLMKLLES